MLDLNSLQLVQALAYSGSFTAAAERLGCTKTKISLQIKALEQQLGVALFRRTTRQVSLTSAGEQLVVEQEGEFRFLLFAQSMTVLLNIEHQPLKMAEAKAVRFDLGMFKRRAIDVFEGRYELAPLSTRRAAPRTQGQCRWTGIYADSSCLRFSARQGVEATAATARQTISPYTVEHRPMQGVLMRCEDMTKAG